jgi:hypothetical protein
MKIRYLDSLTTNLNLPLDIMIDSRRIGEQFLTKKEINMSPIQILTNDGWEVIDRQDIDEEGYYIYYLEREGQLIEVVVR